MVAGISLRMAFLDLSSSTPERNYHYPGIARVFPGCVLTLKSELHMGVAITDRDLAVRICLMLGAQRGVGHVCSQHMGG